MVVVAGLTLTGAPLVTLISPGVITPVPLTKSAVMLALDPASIAAGLAAKLVMEGGGVVDEDPPHPASPTQPRLRATAQAAGAKRLIKGISCATRIVCRLTQPSYGLFSKNCQFPVLGAISARKGSSRSEAAGYADFPTLETGSLNG